MITQNQSPEGKTCTRIFEVDGSYHPWTDFPGDERFEVGGAREVLRFSLTREGYSNHQEEIYSSCNKTSNHVKEPEFSEEQLISRLNKLAIEQ